MNYKKLPYINPETLEFVFEEGEDD